MRTSVAAALLAILLAAPALAQPPVTRNVQFLANKNDYSLVSQFSSKYAACWSYVHGDGREYAILGTVSGTAIYNVTNPAATYFVAFIDGPDSPWREMKSYRNWVYVVTEGTGTGQGVQIISMVDPENPALVNTYTTNFRSSHSVAIDTTRALLICNGTRNTSGLATGVRILSLANPVAPVELSWWPGGSIPVSSANYVHDSTPIGTRLYLASINSGFVRILDTTNPAAPLTLTSWTYPGAFTHNAWPNATESHLYVTDETNGEPLKIFDITNIFSPQLVNAMTSNPQSIVHNAHVKGNDLHLAAYTEGIRLLDLDDPAHPAEFGFADSYPGPSGGFFGVWETCPYFPSGTIIASDMQTGLYVYRFTRDYGIVRAKVVNAANQQPLSGAKVYLTTPTDSLTTYPDGVVQFAPNPGANTVTAKLFGWGQASANVNVGVGTRDTVTLALSLKPTASFNGTVVDATTSTGLHETDVRIAYTPLSTLTGGSGAFSIAGVPDDLYRVEIASPGYAPAAFNRHIGPAFPDPQTVKLTKAPIYDDFETATAWTVGAPGDDATTGIWVRVEPMGTGEPQAARSGAREAGGFAATERPGRVIEGDAIEPARQSRAARRAELLANPPANVAEAEERMSALLTATALVPGDVQPEYDRTPAPGEMCWVTGQGTNPGNIGEQDVDNGRTSLTSVTFDLSGMANPRIGWWQWFHSTGDANDWFAVRISNNNGATWVDVDTLRGPMTTSRWTERSIRVADYVTPTNQVRVRFVAADLGSGSIVEAALDDVIAWDAAVVALDVPAAPAPRMRFATPWPNPARGTVQMALELPAAGAVEVGVYDVSGRLVQTLHRGAAEAGTLSLRWDGTGRSGRVAPAGLYFARAIAGAERAETRFVKVD